MVVLRPNPKLRSTLLLSAFPIKVAPQLLADRWARD